MIFSKNWSVYVMVMNNVDLACHQRQKLGSRSYAVHLFLTISPYACTVIPTVCVLCDSFTPINVYILGTPPKNFIFPLRETVQPWKFSTSASNIFSHADSLFTQRKGRNKKRPSTSTSLQWSTSSSSIPKTPINMNQTIFMKVSEFFWVFFRIFDPLQMNWTHSRNWPNNFNISNWFHQLYGRMTKSIEVKIGQWRKSN